MKIKLLCAFLVTTFLLCSCKEKQSTINTSDSILINVKNSQNSQWNLSSKWSFSEKKICVIFGYGYNSKDFVSLAQNELSNNFGLAQDGGRVLSLVYPDDFKVAGLNRISVLPELLENVSLQGIIILGAPENTHNAINLLKKEYDGTLPFPVFSFFPQDDILGMEFISDFVLEKAVPAETLPTNEEIVIINDDSINLLNSAVRYMELLDSPLPHGYDLITHVQSIAGHFGTVSRYVDPETGLQSLNHFLLRGNE